MSEEITPENISATLARGCREALGKKVVVKRKAVLLALKAEVEGVADAEARSAIKAKCEAITSGNIELDARQLFAALTSKDAPQADVEVDPFDAALENAVDANVEQPE